MRPLSIQILDDAAAPAWNAFVESQPEATFFHLAHWREVLQGVYDFKAHYLYAESNRGIQGILPLAHVKTRLLRDALISTPFCVQGGCVAADRETEAALEAAAAALAKDLGVEYLELRGRRTAMGDDWVEAGAYHGFRRALSSDAAANLKAIPRKERAVVRKSLGGNLRYCVDSDTDTFFSIYATSVRNLGSPVYPRRYFDALRDTFRDSCEILTVLDGGTSVCSVLTFYFRDQVLPYYAGGLPSAPRLGAYHFMYWYLMLRAADRGARVFDFGRSIKGTGAYAFKKNWGFEPKPLPYAYYLVRARRPPNITPSNPNLRLLSRAWTHLPLAVANRLGPMIVSVLA